MAGSVANDMVWHVGMPEWTLAEKDPGLFASPLGQILQGTIVEARAPAETKPAESQHAKQPPSIPAEISKPT